MPCTRHSETPLCVQLSLLVDYDADGPGAAAGDNPSVRKIGGGVGDGDEGYGGVFVGEVGELAEGFFGDCGESIRLD